LTIFTTKKVGYERTKHALRECSFHSLFNPMTTIYNASTVNIYNTMTSLVRFKTKIFSSTFEKTLLPTYNNARSRRICSRRISKVKLGRRFSADGDWQCKPIIIGRTVGISRQLIINVSFLTKANLDPCRRKLLFELGLFSMLKYTLVELTHTRNLLSSSGY
jgi:hypothetical protein